MTAVSRLAAAAAVIAVIGALPWLSGRSPELSVLRARSAEREATPEALSSIRAELGLDAGPLGLLGQWLSGLLRGDLGTSWVSGGPVGPGIAAAAGVSLTLMVCALVAALVTAGLICVPVLRQTARGVPARSPGALGAALTALPEFLLAAVLLIVGAVWLGWFEPYGWTGPASAVLPALAMGLPAGGLLGRLLADGLTAAGAERWVVTWQTAGASGGQVTRALLRRTLPALATQVGLVLVGLTGGAVAVEQVFAVPGLGRAVLGAAESQDLPTLQAGMLVLLAIAAALGGLAGLTRLALLGRALRTGSVPAPPPVTVTRRWAWVLPVGCAAALVLILSVGLGRDPYTSAHPRLAVPSVALPFGADASGRDLLARIAHGTLQTLGTATAVALASLAVGLLIGLLPRLSAGPVEVANAAPPILVGVLVAAAAGPSHLGAAVAVAVVGWAPLAAHVSALSTEIRRQAHVTVLPVLGVGRTHLSWHHVVPALIGPVARHAALRLPGTGLALAALGFLGLGPTPPAPDWGLLLAEGMPYVERASWVVLAPAGVLVVASVLAVSSSGLPTRGRLPRAPTAEGHPEPRRPGEVVRPDRADGMPSVLSASPATTGTPRSRADRLGA